MNAVAPNLISGIAYVTNAHALKDLWDEAEALVPSPGCDCVKSRDFIVYLHKQKLYQFIMGLNDSYSHARNQILMMKPVPSVNQAYAMLVSDESQKNVAATSGILGPLPNVHAGHYESTTFYGSKPTGGQKFRKYYNIQCEFCKLKGHNKENCYKIISYPPDFKYKMKGGAPTTARNTYNVFSETNNVIKNSTTQMCVTTGCILEASHMHTIEGNTAGISTAFLATDNIQEWIIDTGATDHMVSDLSLLTSFNTVDPPYSKKVTSFNTVDPPYSKKVTSFNTVDPPYSKKVFLPNGDVSYVKHVGTSAISNKSVIKNMLHIPQFKFNLMSVSKYLFSGRVKTIGREDKGLYILPSWSSLTDNKHTAETSPAATQNNDMFTKRTPTNVDLKLWHNRLGQVSSSVLNKLFSIKQESCISVVKDCSVCPCARLTRLPFPSSTNKSTASFDLLHLDVWGPYNTFDKQVKYVRTDNGSEFVNSFWGHCVLATVYLINRISSSKLGHRSPYELLYRKKPLLGHLRVLGCLCYAKNFNETDKLQPKAIIVVHMGYSSSHKGYIFLNLSTNSFFVNRDVTFREDIFPFQQFSSHKQFVFPDTSSSVLPHITDKWYAQDTSVGSNQNSTAHDSSVLPHATSSSPSSTDSSASSLPAATSLGVDVSQVGSPALRRSARDKHPPLWTKDFVSLHANQYTPYGLTIYMSYDHLSPHYQAFIASSSSEVELVSYAEAIKDPRWVASMKIKYKASGEIDRFKARLVTKGYNQREGIDYQETFSLVVKMVTVRTILSIAVVQHWNIHQMDVSNAFLQGELHDEIYMDLPQGFVSQGEQQIYRLIKSLYGLKQAPRQ
uniref:Reverse transcriptase Ty1/copia-type domain-containing protein n=1 Tax=Nicotiana tabacum TaxID=4097 RepID=A0A1S3X922_TOBAC|nr:PREDICTED: uncharacterized protein LOC107762549 [Nicotiana tabacum]